MIIFANQPSARWMALFVTLRRSLCPTTKRILDQILTYMVAVLRKKIVNMKCITKVMNRNAKCKHVCFQSYTFTLYIVCRLSNNQTTKEKM